jgi:hypothetical protein
MRSGGAGRRRGERMIGGYGRGWRHRRTYYATGFPGYGRGRGMGLGRGWAQVNPYVNPVGAVRPISAMEPGVYGAHGSKEDEMAYLEDMKNSIEEELEGIKQRLKEMSGANREK